MYKNLEALKNGEKKYSVAQNGGSRQHKKIFARRRSNRASGGSVCPIEPLNMPKSLLELDASIGILLGPVRPFLGKIQQF